MSFVLFCFHLFVLFFHDEVFMWSNVQSSMNVCNLYMIEVGYGVCLSVIFDSLSLSAYHCFAKFISDGSSALCLYNPCKSDAGFRSCSFHSFLVSTIDASWSPYDTHAP